MEVRTATEDDASNIREIAAGTFQTSYALSPEQIQTLLEGLFDDDELAKRLESDDHTILVAEDERTVEGFVDVHLGETTVIRWLHVDPDSRGRDVGTRLLEHVRTELASGREDRLAARVMAAAREGEGFCEQFGFEREGRSRLDFGGETFWEHVYATGSRPEGTAGARRVEPPESFVVDDVELYLDLDDEIPGIENAFYPVYESERYDDRWGFFCTNCGSTDTGSDTLGRLECQNCGNKHLADEWDAAYL